MPEQLAESAIMQLLQESHHYQQDSATDSSKMAMVHYHLGKVAMNGHTDNVFEDIEEYKKDFVAYAQNAGEIGQEIATSLWENNKGDVADYQDLILHVLPMV